MELLVARGLHHWAGGSRVFGPVELSLQTGMRVALAGAAGSGQSSLLSILAGQLSPAEGELRLAPGSTARLLGPPVRPPAGLSAAAYARTSLQRVQHLETRLRQAELTLDSEAALQSYADLAAEFEAAGGYTAAAELAALLSGFGLDAARLEQPADSLSAGELRRLELARVLLGRPDVLLLDSPDAGLDAAMADLLAQELARWSGAVVFSSHDRFFINQAASHVGMLSAGTLQLRRGGFAASGRRQAPTISGGSRRELLTGKDATLRLGNDQLLQLKEFSVSAGDRILLAGANGSGKSSLLAFIATDLHHGQGQSGLNWQGRVSLTWLDQLHAGLDPELSPLHNLTVRMSRQRAQQLLALVRLETSAWNRPLSSQTRSALAQTGLALLLADESELVLLDELDSGLDLHGLLLLEEHLKARPGAVIMVSHDRQLAVNFASRVWTLEEARLWDWRGGVEGWQAGRLRREDEPAAAVVAPPLQPEPSDPVLETENELLDVTERLELQPELNPRTRARLERRRLQLTAQLMEHFDRGLPAPAPRFRVRESGLVLQADLSPDGQSLVFTEVAGIRPVVTVQAGVAHLRLEVPADRCLLPHWRPAFINAATRLCFYTLNVRVIQFFSAAHQPGLLLEDAGAGWHALPRSRFERLEGWVSASPARRRRRRS